MSIAVILVAWVLVNALAQYVLRDSRLSGVDFVRVELHRIRRRFDLAAIRTQANTNAVETRRQFLQELGELEREGEGQ